jgi:hypothetical protein
MRKAAIASVAISTLAVGLALGCTGQVDSSPPEASSSSEDLSASPSANPDQSGSPDEPRTAETTQKLEEAFSDQFVKGQIDRDALAPLVDDVLQAVPAEERSNVKAHIDDVIALGQQTAAQMTPEERAKLVATPPAGEGKVQIAPIGWFGGWRGGFGGWSPGWSGGFGGWSGGWRGGFGGWFGGWRGGFGGWWGGWSGGWSPGWSGGWSPGWSGGWWAGF